MNLEADKHLIQIIVNKDLYKLIRYYAVDNNMSVRGACADILEKYLKEKNDKMKGRIEKYYVAKND